MAEKPVATKKTILFGFDTLSSSDKAAKAVTKYFARAGANVISVDATGKIKRTSGISYRELTLSFADSQTLTLRVKQSGDVYNVLLNGKLVAVKNQDDQVAAVAELVAMMSAARTKFQAKLAKANIKLPPSIKTAAPKLMAVLIQKRDDLKSAIADVRAEIEQIRSGR